ncbi:radical SAM protein [Amycolatopsis sp. NBC_01286]|uniref:radical SAM protein n=1 Tax=Amycolatopsis sp. NBC_01286 TaxID=2903560 RepID=UPI002E0F9849|nr:radical SAM protein [Amycolatopsis sp. NBC_01286]
MQILLTERCNLRCRHCAVPAEDSPADHEVDIADWLAFVDVLAAGGLRSLVLSGGEALLRPEAVDVAIRALERGVEQTTLVTNGLIFRGAIPAKIADAQRRFPGFGVHVSLDGCTAATHDWMRGRGTFRRTLRSLDRLREAGGRTTGVHTVFHRGNVHEFDECAALAKELGASSWTVFPIAALGRATQIQERRLDEAVWRDLISRSPGLERRYGLSIGVMGPVLSDEWPETAPDLPTPRFPHAQQTCVGPDGEVFTCPPLRDRPVGTLQDVVDRQDWHTVAERAGDLLRAECSGCKLILLCTGVRLDSAFHVREG